MTKTISGTCPVYLAPRKWPQRPPRRFQKNPKDYHFTAIAPTQLEVYDEHGRPLFDFRAEGTMGFRVKGEFLEPTRGTLPPVPRTHSALNIGYHDYYEILVEHKPPKQVRQEL